MKHNSSAPSLLFLSALSLLLSACQGVKAPQASALVLTRPPEIRTEADIAALVAAMTLEEKVGQMVQTDIAVVTPEEVREHSLGSIISLLPSGEIGTTEGWRAIADAYQREALQMRLGIPIVFGIDAVHGHSYFDGNSVILPHNIGLGATRNPDLVRQLASVTASELLATGVRWTFSPTIAVARNIRWGRTYESFGETVELQRMFAAAMVEGYQGMDPSGPDSVGATAKHFVADGATTDGIDRGDAVISEEEMRRRHLPGFLDAIDRGVVSVMASFSAFNGEKVHGSKALLNDLLKEELGFDGVVLTDWEGVRLAGLPLDAGANAGIDMFMFAESWRTSLPELIAHVQAGDVPMARIDDAVTRILRMKLRLGLFQDPLSSDRHAVAMGSPAHRDLARQAVRESLVLLKNANDLLPLSKNDRIIVAGGHADNVAYQCGGWTKKWQGAHADLYHNPARPVEGATSILDGIVQQVGADRVFYTEAFALVEDAKVAIVVVGETPYAEGIGDRAASDLVLSDSDAELIAAYHEAGLAVVTVLISGRPLLINPQLEQSEAVVAAWLPGSEGDGIAEVLFGEANFSGKLGFSWPRSAEQIPINVGDEGYDPLFPYGYGLRYGADALERDEMGLDGFTQ
jgi:beta-glucosidase